MKNIDIVKNILMENGYTCVLYKDGEKYHSNLRGVKPLLDFLDSGVNYSGFVAADKTVGAGAAHLYVLLGIKSVFAKVISEAGANVLEQNGISVYYETKVPYIINRAGNGPCPIENAVSGINSSAEALTTIKQTLKSLNS